MPSENPLPVPNAQAAPVLNIPASQVTCRVRAIDTTFRLHGFAASDLWNPSIPGFDRFRAGTLAFLIEHPSGKKLLYDLGYRKDWQNLAPATGVQKAVQMGLIQIEVDKNVSAILLEGGIKLEEIDGLIWSHWHFDHTGDPSTFPPTTALIVGPGTIDNFLPGYPADPASPILESDYANRQLIEIDFTREPLQIGRFQAMDYFGDGSFYLLDSPGHAIGHINALVRTTPSPSPSFIHLCGDSAHHAAEIRPSIYLPLPEVLCPSPIPNLYPMSCPGHHFAPILRNSSRTEHILEFHEAPGADSSKEKKYRMVVDEGDLRDTIRKIEEVDANTDVFTVLAHDWSLVDVIDLFPAEITDWKRKGWKETTRWKFLEEFAIPKNEDTK